MMTRMVETIIQAVSPLFGTGAAAGAAGAASAGAAAAGAAAGAAATGAASGADAAGAAAEATGAEAAGLASSACTGADSANRMDTPASNVVIVFFIKLPLKELRCRFHRYECV